MAISPPSDLVLDVVRAADPGAVEAARDKLIARGADGAVAADPAGFQTTLAGAADLRSTLAAMTPATAGATGSKAGAIPESYRKFEAMVLGNFVKSMLPSESEEVFGQGTAGNMWKGLMADELGKAIAKGGGIGIADHLLGDHMKEGSSLTDTPQITISGNNLNLANSLVHEMQMNAFHGMMPGVEADGTKDDGNA